MERRSRTSGIRPTVMFDNTLGNYSQGVKIVKRYYIYLAVICLYFLAVPGHTQTVSETNVITITHPQTEMLARNNGTLLFFQLKCPKLARDEMPDNSPSQPAYPQVRTQLRQITFVTLERYPRRPSHRNPHSFWGFPYY